MAKRKGIRRGTLIFILFLCVYAVIFLTATAIGLDFLWEYLDAYELSRPKHGIEAYMETLTPEYIMGHCADLIDSVDPNAQSRENCEAVLRQTLSGKFTYVRNLTESTDDKIVYQLRSGSTVIGYAEMTPSGESIHGFTPWAVTGDRFDLSFLLQPAITVTAPADYPVSVNGLLLTEESILESGIHFSLLEEFYDTYSLPTIVTYRAGPFLSEPEVTIRDPQGDPVTIDENTDWNRLLPQCTDQETEDLDRIIQDFLTDYVAFTSVTGGDTQANYEKLLEHILPGGELAKRMYAAIDGLYWVSDRGASLVGIQTDHYVPFGQGRYLCDLTYRVNTRDITGQIQTESHVKLLLLHTDKGWYVESIISC